MPFKKTLKNCITTSCLLICINLGFSQSGNVTLNANPDISSLLQLKKEINKNENTSDRYKIQIYSGNRDSAESAIESFKNSFSDTTSRLVYETPNYKVWTGNYRSRLEADRALIKIKDKFPSAFIFKPKK